VRANIGYFSDRFYRNWTILFGQIPNEKLRFSFHQGTRYCDNRFFLTKSRFLHVWSFVWIQVPQLLALHGLTWYSLFLVPLFSNRAPSLSEHSAFLVCSTHSMPSTQSRDQNHTLDHTFHKRKGSFIPHSTLFFLSFCFTRNSKRRKLSER
jgi:hypothetical protein